MTPLATMTGGIPRIFYYFIATNAVLIVVKSQMRDSREGLGSILSAVGIILVTNLTLILHPEGAGSNSEDVGTADPKTCSRTQHSLMRAGETVPVRHPPLVNFMFIPYILIARRKQILLVKILADPCSFFYTFLVRQSSQCFIFLLFANSRC